MNNDYNSQRKWTDKWNNKIINILTDYFRSQFQVKIATEQMDMKEATDLTIFESQFLNKITIASRIRTNFYFEKYPNDITIRTKTQSGSRNTELYKILFKGFGTHFFYGFSNKEETDLCKWVLCDMHILRVYLKNFLTIYLLDEEDYKKDYADCIILIKEQGEEMFLKRDMAFKGEMDNIKENDYSKLLPVNIIKAIELLISSSLPHNLILTSSDTFSLTKTPYLAELIRVVFKQELISIEKEISEIRTSLIKKNGKKTIRPVMDRQISLF